MPLSICDNCIYKLQTVFSYSVKLHVVYDGQLIGRTFPIFFFIWPLKEKHLFHTQITIGW